MKKNNDPTGPESKKEAQKLKSAATRGKNEAGQTNGQFEQDTKHRTGQFTGAGNPPLMKK